MIRKILTPVLLFVLALAGCSSNVPTPEVTVTETVTATPTFVADAPCVEETNDDLFAQWVSDPNREVLFQDYPTAATIVAQALLDGEFGPAFKYNEWKSEWTPGQTGWGGISANAGGDATYDKPGAFAWVYWNADGTVDWSKGVPDFSIDMGPNHIGVMYFSNHLFDDSIKHSIVLDSKSNNGDSVYLSSFENCPPSNSANMTYTRTVTELVRVETDAMRALFDNMVALIGVEEWAKQV